MSTLTHSRTVAGAVRGSQHVVLLAPVHALRGRKLLKAVLGKWAGLASRMVEDAEPGDLGSLLTTFTGASTPKRLSIGVLPDSVSRHVSPSRNHAIHHCLAKADLRRGRVGVVLALDDAAHLTAAANAVGRAFPLYDRKSRRSAVADVVLAAVDGEGRELELPDQVPVVVEMARWAASMVDHPTAELTTAGFVAAAQALLKGTGRQVKTRVIVGDDLLAARLNGIHAVGRGASVPPRLLILEHSPKGASRTVALVGKGIVFDTGGLAIKPRESMVGMKGDMGGGAAVAGAFRALVSAGSPHRVLALVPLAENAIGPEAYRHDEILTLHSGKTVEINNTDAEGRLLLADGVSHAARELGAEVVIDIATLTGAQLVATGKRHAAVVSNREGLERLAVEVGLETGDLCHPLPFAPEFFQREFRSDYADMLNSVRDRANAQASCAAQFVWSHLESTGVPWLHVDIAGPGAPDRKASGFGVALLTRLVQSLEDGHLAR